ncbi:MAG: beta-ketoacyl-[acyl-carrier-protein] synthase family protein [Thermoanaerobaculia bacterium]
MDFRPRTSPSREVAITGLGAVTAFGLGVECLWRALLLGESALAPVTLFDPSRYQARCAAEVPLVPPDPQGVVLERGHRLALAAGAEALGPVSATFGGPRAGVVLGTSLGGNRLWTSWLSRNGHGGERPKDELQQSSISSATRLLALRTGARGPALTLSVACASGTAAIGVGAELIRRGEADQVLAGGYDALSEFVFAGFDSLRALSTTTVRPFDHRRDGLGLGEGAGFVLLEELEGARRRGGSILALVRGYSSASDAHHMTRPSPVGEGLVHALEAALGKAGVGADAIGFVSAHGTATPYNDRMEAAGLRRVFGERIASVPTNSIKGALGHTLGAAGALEAVMTTLVLRHGLIPPTANLVEIDPAFEMDVVAGSSRILAAPLSFAASTSSAFAGTNAALVLERA